VWVSGLILPDSPPGRVLEAVRRGRVEAVASWELVEEIVEVLGRPRLRRYGITETDAEDVLILLAPFLPSVEIDVPIRDPDDAPVVAAALQGNAEAIVSGDSDLFQDDLVAWLVGRGIEVLRPTAVLERLLP
jgi:putative PIN family toxin of toxin-antitoxin system